MDFSFVTARLATGGGIFTPDDLTKLVEAGVTVIIDCRAEADDSALIAGSPYANRLQYLWNGVNDDGVHDQAKIDWLKRSLRFAMPLFGSCGAVVYAHCGRRQPRSLDGIRNPARLWALFDLRENAHLGSATGERPRDRIRF